MASQRKLIRAAMVQMIKDASIGNIGDSVYPNRWLPTWETELPAIFVYTHDEGVAVHSVAPREVKRTSKIVTEVISKADESLDDSLDDLSDLIEDTLSADPQLNETCDSLFLTGVELELFTEGDALMGSLKLTWDVVHYKYMPGDLSGDLPDFKTIDSKTSLENAQADADQTSQTITVQS